MLCSFIEGIQPPVGLPSHLVAHDSTNSLDFSNLRRLILPKEIVQEDNLFFAFIKRYVIFYFMNKTDQEYDMTGSQLE